MAQKLTASMPTGYDLDGNYTIRVTAVDPASGDVVSGVVVSDVSIMCKQVAGESLEQGDWFLVPGVNV